MSKLSNFEKVSKDAFHGVDTKAKLPDGSSGRSISKYATVDGNITIPSNGVSYIVFSGNASTPVKCWTFSESGANNNGGKLSIVDYKNYGGLGGLQGQYSHYNELTWKAAVCEPGIRNFSRSHDDSYVVDEMKVGDEDATVDLTGDINENFAMGINRPSGGLSTTFGRVPDLMMTIAAQAGGVETCPKRWRMVSGSLKIQSLNKAEYTAGYWKSVDYFPQRSYQTLGLYYPPSKVEVQAIGAQPYGTGAGTNSWGSVIKSTSNEIGLKTPSDVSANTDNIRVGIDLKVLDGFLEEEPYFGEKPSYNEGSVESLKAVQFNLQRKAGTVDWCTQGIIHTDMPQRIIGSTEIVSKLPVTLQNAGDRWDPNVEKTPSSNAGDRMYYENLPVATSASFHNINHRMYGFHTHGMAGTTGAPTVPVGVSQPPCLSIQGLEADAAMKQIIEAQQDLNMSCKCIVLRNTGPEDSKFRLTTGGVFEVTHDLDSTEFQHMRPTSAKDGAVMRKMQKLGTSASRRFSR